MNTISIGNTRYIPYIAVELILGVKEDRFLVEKQVNSRANFIDVLPCLAFTPHDQPRFGSQRAPAAI